MGAGRSGSSTERSTSSITSASDALVATDTSDTCSLDETPTSSLDRRTEVKWAVAVSEKTTKWKKTRAKVEEICTEFLDALSETNKQLAERQPNELAKLKPNALRRDIFRCSSLCLLVVYLYSVFNELLVPLVLFMFTVSGAQLVFDVARRAQALLTVLADVLEKWRAIFRWEKPEVTLRFVFLISFFFWLSVLTSFTTFMTVIGFLCGGKAFVMSYAYHRFPRLRYLDTLPLTASNSAPSCPACIPPTAEQFRRRSLGVYSLSEVDARSVSLSSKETESEGTIDESEEVFKITRSCALVDKAAPFPRNVIHGTAILNDEMLQFRYKNTKNGMVELIEMPFASILSLRKFKTLRPLGRFRPTASKGIELKLAARRKPLQLVGMAKRDDFYELLVETARLSGVELEEEGLFVPVAQ
ncbi:GRAM domain-containing protein [Aphelenchoides fujianensis]|nr:GRAM domain-containing protein [Aphelenchoides fujianensis]